jgi:predicted deacylase
MRTERLKLPGVTPGLTYELTFLHFGREGARPKAYVQAGLHADEAPGMLAAHHLRQRLAALEAEGLLKGHVVLAPAANPIGLAQHHQGTHHGRFDFADGVNFNRGFPDLAQATAEAVAGRLTDDGSRNADLIRAALLSALSAGRPVKPADHLKLALLAQAVDADTVLDLHCDGEADVHLYTLTTQADDFQLLADQLGASALLTSDVSGDNPFDEAASRPWRELAERYPDKPIPPGCIAATVELRGEADVNHALARVDAEAIVRFLAGRGHAELAPAPSQSSTCRPTPLAGSEALEAPVAGLLVYAAATGRAVEKGALIAEIIDPVTGETTLVRATTSGVFYARACTRFATAGRRLGKIAGGTPFRSGKLLSP